MSVRYLVYERAGGKAGWADFFSLGVAAVQLLT